MSTVRLQDELSYEDAMQVLGYEPGALVSPHFPAFRKVEAKLGELVNTTKDAQLQTNFREEMERLRAALRVLEGATDREPPRKVKGMGLRFLVSLAFVAVIVGAAGWANQMLLEDRVRKLTWEIEGLAVDGRIAVENRRWEEAEEIYATIEGLDPDSEVARAGMRSIEAGKEVERAQKLSYLVGSARAAVEERRWADAETFAREALEMEPNQEEALGFLEAIKEGRVLDKITGVLDRAELALRNENWTELQERTAELAAMAPGHPDLSRLRAESARGMQLMEERRLQALQLYERARSLDTGDYSQEALDVLREAIRLSDQPEIQALYRKMSAYTRLLSVPAEFPTIGEALQAAREGDKIVVAPGTYQESLRLERKVDLEGSGPDETVVECAADTSSVVQVGKEASGSRLAGMTMRQTGIFLADERYPVLALDQSEASIEDCRVENGAGHGIAVLHGARAKLRNVQVLKCGWDGLAVYGVDSRAEVSDCRFEGNIHHGIDAWSGGSVDVSKSRSTENGLAGVVLMSPQVESSVVQSISDQNREVGMVVSNGSVAVLRSNRSEGNLLGGFLVEGEGTRATLEGNVAERNGKVGILVDQRSELASFKENVARDNSGEQENLKAVMPEEEIKPPPAIEPPRAIPVEPPQE